MTTSQATLPQRARRGRRSALARRERNWGLLFLSPWIIGFLAFYLLPMIASLVFSFTNFDSRRPEDIDLVGFQNWQRLVNDSAVRQSVVVTGRFMLISIPVTMATALGLAVLLNSRQLRGKAFFRTLYYLPIMFPAIASTIVWRGVLNGQSGWVTKILQAVNLPAPDWYQDSRWVIPGLTLLGMWGVGNAMLVLLAGLQSVPTELYEAAKVDGAGPVFSFFKITLPMITPVLFYNLVIAVIAGFQYFLPTFVLYNAQAGPENAAQFYMLNLYKEAFVFSNMGYASALAWAMFVIALIVTALLFSTANRWVYYAGGEE